jgi:hypothetical protein
MSLSVKARSTGTSRRGRHAIERARPAADVPRLRHGQLMLPRGVHRTRMSETRTRPGSAAVRRVRAAPRSPDPSVKRTEAVRLPASTG